MLAPIGFMFHYNFVLECSVSAIGNPEAGHRTNATRNDPVVSNKERIIHHSRKLSLISLSSFQKGSTHCISLSIFKSLFVSIFARNYSFVV